VVAAVQFVIVAARRLRPTPQKGDATR
jgi:hypothetical protein